MIGFCTSPSPRFSGLHEKGVPLSLNTTVPGPCVSSQGVLWRFPLWSAFIPLGVALVCIFTDNPPQPLLDLLSDRQDRGKEKTLPLRRRPRTLILSICYQQEFTHVIALSCKGGCKMCQQKLGFWIFLTKKGRMDLGRTASGLCYSGKLTHYSLRLCWPSKNTSFSGAMASNPTVSLLAWTGPQQVAQIWKIHETKGN